MIKLGANSVLFAAFDLETAMRQIARAGYDGVELSAIKGMCEHLDLDSYKGQIERIKSLAADNELELLAIEEAALDEERLLRCFDAAAQLGIPVVNVGPGGKSGMEEDFLHQTDLLQALSDKIQFLLDLVYREIQASHLGMIRRFLLPDALAPSCQVPVIALATSCHDCNLWLLLR